MVEASVTAYGKCVLHEHLERLALLRHPLYGSTFDAFIAGETMSWQVLIQGGTQAKVAGCQIRIVWKWSKGFQLTFCSIFWDRCAVWGLGIITEENCIVAKKTETLSVPTGSVWQTSKRDQFSKWVTMLNCRSHMPPITCPWELDPSFVCINSSWSCNQVGIYNNRACKLFSSTLLHCKLQKPKLFV